MITELFIKNPNEYKQLNNEEFKELFIKFKNGDDKAYEKLFLHNLNLVVYEMNHKFYSSNYDKQEIIQVGCIGLINALNNFDMIKDNQFSTYAIKCIDNILYRYVRKLDYNNLSLNEVIYLNEESEEITLEDALSSDEDVAKDYLEIEKRELIEKVINDLKPHEQEIIKMYFGFYNKSYTMLEIGLKFDMTKSNVSRIIKDVLRKIKPKLCENEKISSRNLRIFKTQSIYQLFKEHSKEEIDNMILKLTQDERKLLELRYGKDLEKPVTSSDWNEESKIKFYDVLMPKMRKILNGQEVKQRNTKINNIYEIFKDYSKEEVDFVINLLPTDELELIKLRFGNDLSMFISENNLTDNQNYLLYRLIIPKMKRKLIKINTPKVKKLKKIK